MYGKIFASMYEGSMVGAGPVVFAVWGYCIAKADVDGTVLLNPNLLAPIIGTSKIEIEDAIKYLESPDQYSKNPEHDGRRLLHQTGHLFFVVSHEVYRSIKSNEDRREYMREYQRKRRAKAETKEGVNSLQSLQEVTKVYPASAYASSSVSKIGGEGGRNKPDNPASSEAITQIDPQFARCWEAFEKYGVKKIALKYWRKYSQADRDKIEAAIPDYNEAVRAGRPRKQFEGWINPEHRLWDMDWRKAAEVAREKNAPPKLVNTFHAKTKDKSLLAF